MRADVAKSQTLRTETFEETMSRPWPRLLCAGALMLLSQLAHAQYSWIDAKGTRVFSDRPPPPGTPANRILKAPHTAAPRTAPDDAAPVPPAVPAPAPKPAGPTLAEREADYRKRAAQREADDAKAAQEAQRKAALAEQCAAARRGAATLASGVRMTETNDKGEQVILSDDERARRLATARSATAQCN
jgi:type IV secretory pathway VirB10-like protein